MFENIYFHLKVLQALLKWWGKIPLISCPSFAIYPRYTHDLLLYKPLIASLHRLLKEKTQSYFCDFFSIRYSFLILKKYFFFCIFFFVDFSIILLRNTENIKFLTTVKKTQSVFF